MRKLKLRGEAVPEPLRELVHGTAGHFQLSSDGIIHPMSHTRKFYDLIVLAGILYSAFTVPFRLGFKVTLHTFGLMWMLEIGFDVFFWSEIIVNARTGYYYKGILILDSTRILKRYLLSWFLVDVLCVIPFDVMFPDKQWGALLRMLRITKVGRLMTRVKMHKISEKNRIRLEANKQATLVDRVDARKLAIEC